MKHFVSLDKLTWHGGAIPSDEVWVKIGGDKGGSSFKMNFHIMNVPNPNSVHNTSIPGTRHHPQPACSTGPLQRFIC